MADTSTLVGFAPDPDNPGWYKGADAPTGRFADIYGQIRVRPESADTARLRLTPEFHHLNLLDYVHGGFLLAIVDQALFVGPAALGIENAIGGMTIETATQFLAPVRAGEPVDVVVDVLRVTGRMIFLRGLIEQAGVTSLAFSGTIRKASAR